MPVSELSEAGGRTGCEWLRGTGAPQAACRFAQILSETREEVVGGWFKVWAHWAALEGPLHVSERRKEERLMVCLKHEA